MSRGTIPTWVTSCVIAAIALISTGGIGALHRHTDHPPPTQKASTEHQSSHCHHHHGDHHSHTEESPDSPGCPDDHKDCDICLLIMIGGQWGPVEAPTHSLPIVIADSAETPIERAECQLHDRATPARGPPMLVV